MDHPGYHADSSRLDLDSVRVVSWDVDGTLYSTRRAAGYVTMEAAAWMIRRRSREPLRELGELRRIWRRMEDVRAGRSAFVRAGSARRLELETRWCASAIRRAGLRSGIRELLFHFRTRVRAQVVLSDYDPGYKLRSLGLEEYFDAVYVGERLGFLKPSPAPYRKILEDWNLSPENLLHIGDRPETDGAGAAAAGCPSLVLGRDFGSFDRLHARLSA